MLDILTRNERNERLFRTLLQSVLIVQIGGMLFSIALSSIAFVTSIAVFVCLAVVSKDRFAALTRTGLEWYFAAYLAAVAIMVVFAIYPEAALISSRRVLLIADVYLVAVALRTEQDIRRFILALAIIVAVQSGIELTFVILGKLERINLFQHYMTAGGIKMILVLVMLPLLFIGRTQRGTRIVIAVAVILASTTLLLTQTRSSWLGFAAGFLFLAVFQHRKLLIAIPAAAIIIFIAAPSSVMERFTNIVSVSPGSADTTATVASNMNRIRMWKTGWQIFTEYPVTGVGDGEMGTIYRWYVTPEDPAEGCHLHNNYIHVLATHGILGFVAMMALFVAIVMFEWKVWRYGNPSPVSWIAGGTIAAFLGFAVNGLAEYNFGDHEILVLLWFTVGVAVSLRRIQVEPAFGSHHIPKQGV